MTALKRRDIDLVAGTVPVRFAYTEQDNGKMLLGPPKSRAGRRTVSIPAGIIPVLEGHLEKYTKRDDDALVFTGIKGGPLRRSGFNKLTRWVDVVRTMGVPGLHFHDLRHTGNTLAADMGVSLRNLMARTCLTGSGRRGQSSGRERGSPPISTPTTDRPYGRG